jgi:hypothetical protein
MLKFLIWQAITNINHSLFITPNPINDSYGWHLPYLTIIGLAISTLSFTIGLLSDLTLLPILYTIKNVLGTVASPLSLLISILYWTLRAIDPALVIPETSPNPPVLTDLGFHLFPTILLTLDHVFLSPPWEIKPVSSFVLSGLIAGVYWLWVEKCFEQNGFYPYPLFRDAGFEGRVMLFSGAAIVMVINTWGLKCLYTAVNGRGALEEKTEKGQ